MNQAVQKVIWKASFAFVAMCGFCTLGVAQDGRTISPSELAQTIDRVRSSTTDTVMSEALIIGTGLLRSGRFTEAIQLFSVLAGKKPNDAGILYGLALATFNTGRAAEAEVIVRRAIDVAPKEAHANDADSAQRSADALVLLGVILAVKGDDAAALKAVRQALNLAPNHFDARLALGRALFGMGDNSGAIQAFQAARVLQPTNGQVLFFLATALERSGDIKAALSTYRELIAMKPDSYDGHLGLGVLLLKSGGRDGDEGLKELERALEINPNLYEGRVALGRALVVRGRWNDAAVHLLRAAELAPNNPEPHYQLSIAYRRLGRKEEAAKEAAIVKRIHESRRSKGSNVVVAP